MDETEKGAVYERLLAIKVDIDPDPNPSPGYINSKIWECHRYIEEVERYHIQLSRETSVVQQALNNADAEYQTKFGNLLGQAEIKALPNVADREARANQFLKAERERIKGLKNDIGSLENLLKAVALKLKNLNRLNGDIRLQVRILESQIKLSTAPKDDPVTRGLLEEMGKGIQNTDSFMDAKSSVDLSVAMDGTGQLDMGELLGEGAGGGNNLQGSEPAPVDASLVDPVPDVAPAPEADAPGEALSSEIRREAAASDAEDDEAADAEAVAEEYEPFEFATGGDSGSEPAEDAVVDLDQAIIPPSPAGAAPKPEPAPAREAEPAPAEADHKEHEQQKPAAVDLDGLLDSLFTKKE